MVRLIMSDDQEGSYAKASFNWDKITHSLEPETDHLPKQDKDYFQSNISFLIGKDIRLSNLPEKFYAVFVERADYNILLTWYPMIIPHEFINREIARYLNRLGTLISLDGLGWKFGPMGFQQQHIKQEVIGVPTKEGGR